MKHSKYISILQLGTRRSGNDSQTGFASASKKGTDLARFGERLVLFEEVVDFGLQLHLSGLRQSQLFLQLCLGHLQPLYRALILSFPAEVYK